MKSISLLLFLLFTLVYGDGSIQSGSLSIQWVSDLSTSTVEFNLTSSLSSGWAGVGLSASAAHSNMWAVAAWIGSAGTPVISEGISNSQAQPTAVGNSLINKYSVAAVNGKLLFSFRRTLNGIPDSVLLSYGYSARAGSGSTYPIHESRGSTKLDLKTKCKAKPIVQNPDVLLYDQCMMLDSTNKVRMRWSVVGSSIKMQVDVIYILSIFL
jgi:hypothetical protein